MHQQKPMSATMTDAKETEDASQVANKRSAKHAFENVQTSSSVSHEI